MFDVRIFSAIAAIAVCVGLVIASSRTVYAVSDSLLLNEVQTAAVGDSGMEFVELYNAGSSLIALDDMRLSYRSAAGEHDTTLYRFTEHDVIASHGYFLLVHAGKNIGRTPDAIFAAGMAQSGGGLALRTSDNLILDRLGWGTAGNIFVEGTAAAAPGAGRSLERLMAIDTDNNAVDFTIQDFPNPRNSGDTSAVPIPPTFFTFAVSALVLWMARMRILS